jgi:hypothetical protein
MKFYKVRSLKNGYWLRRTDGFFESFQTGTTYNTKGGAKAGFSGYKRRNDWNPNATTEVEIVEFEANEISTEKI